MQMCFPVQNHHTDREKLHHVATQNRGVGGGGGKDSSKHLADMTIKNTFNRVLYI